MGTGPANTETAALLSESPRLLTVNEYHRIAEAGIFDEDERVELLEGVIVAMTPQSAPHARRIEWLTRFLVRRLGDEYAVRPQLPLTLDDRNEPEPDLAVVRSESSTEDRHPGTALLVVEVAGESLRRDRQLKAAVYARAGVGEYWIVNLEERLVEILSDPDRASSAYRRTRVLGLSDELVSEVLPELCFPVSSLFA